MNTEANQHRVKMIVGCKRKPDISLAAFQQYWRNEHAPIVARASRGRGMVRYVQNHVVSEAGAASEPAFDGVAEAWFDSPKAAGSLARSADYAAVREDEACFVDRSSLFAFLTEEVVSHSDEASHPEIKRIQFFKRRPDTKSEYFHFHWRELHAPLVGALPGLMLYVRCRPCVPKASNGQQHPYDGVEMIGYRDREALAASELSPAFIRIREDRSLFLDEERVASVLAHPVEIPLEAAPAAHSMQAKEIT